MVSCQLAQAQVSAVKELAGTLTSVGQLMQKQGGLNATMNDFLNAVSGGGNIYRHDRYLQEHIYRQHGKPKLQNLAAQIEAGNATAMSAMQQEFADRYFGGASGHVSKSVP